MVFIRIFGRIVNNRAMNDVILIVIVLLFIGAGVYKSFLKEQESARQRKRVNKPERPQSESVEQAARAVPLPPSLARHAGRKRPSTKPQPVAATPKPAASHPSVRMKTRADARRAFIYSEIFNRKY